MSEIHIRLKEIRKTFNLTIREFAEKIHFSTSLYGAIEHGDRPPNDRIIELIVSKFNINKNYILKGEGSMFNTDYPKDLRLKHILDVYNQGDDLLRDSLLEMSNILLKIHKK